MSRADRLILAIALAVSAFALVVRSLPAWGKVGAGLIQVEIGGRLVKEIPLQAADAPPRTIPIGLPRGRAFLSLEKGGVRILPMPRRICPRAVCSHSGLIRRPGEALICAPNALVVRIAGQSPVDAVAR